MAYGVWQNVIQSSLGAPYVGASITVLDSDTQEPVDLYIDRDGSDTLAQPVLTDDTGFARFYCREGRVDISIVKGGASQQLENVVIIADFP